MDISEKIELNGAIFTKDNIVKLMEIVNKYTNESEILNIKFSDGIEYSNIGIEDLKQMNFENLIIKDIKMYIMSKWDSKYKNKFILYYSEIFKQCTLEYSSSNRDQFSSIRSDILDWKKNITAREKMINFIYSWYSQFILTFIIFLLIMLSVVDALKNESLFNILGFNIFLMFAVYVILVIPSIKLIKYSYPKTEINIGINKSAKVRKYLWLLLTIIIIPIILNFAI